MAGYLLDTNALSELVRSKPNASVIRWLRAADEASLFVSVLSLGEIRKGITLVTDVRRRNRLETWLQNDLVRRFASRILPIDASIADRWGRLLAAAASAPLPTIDALLAATAFEHSLTLITRNLRDFERTGVPVHDPWRAGP